MQAHSPSKRLYLVSFQPLKSFVIPETGKVSLGKENLQWTFLGPTFELWLTCIAIFWKIMKLMGDTFSQLWARLCNPHPRKMHCSSNQALGHPSCDNFVFVLLEIEWLCSPNCPFLWIFTTSRLRGVSCWEGASVIAHSLSFSHKLRALKMRSADGMLSKGAEIRLQTYVWKALSNIHIEKVPLSFDAIACSGMQMGMAQLQLSRMYKQNRLL